jgi:RNA polymerase sigma-70 factor (ECF subfamily)
LLKDLSLKEDGSEIVPKLSKGDTAAIEELYRLYFDRLYSMIYNQVGMSHSNAEDVAQETWLAAIKSIRKFRGDCRPYTWLCSIAWHKIRDFQRRHYRSSARIRQLPPDTEITELRFIDSAPLPEQIVEKEETRELVRRVLSSLPSHYQQVLTLKYVEEMSAKEINKTLNKSIKSVESMLDRARLALRDGIVRAVSN